MQPVGTDLTAGIPPLVQYRLSRHEFRWTSQRVAVFDTQKSIHVARLVGSNALQPEHTVIALCRVTGEKTSLSLRHRLRCAHSIAGDSLCLDYTESRLTAAAWAHTAQSLVRSRIAAA